MFNDIIDAYKEVHKIKSLSLGRKQMLNAARTTNVSWVYIEVSLNPLEENVKSVDLI